MPMLHVGEVGAAFVLDDPMTDAQWLELIQRNSSPNPPPHPAAYACPLPTAHVGLLRPKVGVRNDAYAVYVSTWQSSSMESRSVPVCPSCSVAAVAAD